MNQDAYVIRYPNEDHPSYFLVLDGVGGSEVCRCKIHESTFYKSKRVPRKNAEIRARHIAALLNLNEEEDLL